jgi:hypothetical protein
MGLPVPVIDVFSSVLPFHGSSERNLCRAISRMGDRHVSPFLRTVRLRDDVDDVRNRSTARDGKDARAPVDYQTSVYRYRQSELRCCFCEH